MDSLGFLSVLGSVGVMVVVFLIVFLFKKYEALTYVEYFLKDKNGPYFHILGARRIMPEDGESYDIFEYYVLEYNQLKFIKGGAQKGKNLDLKSDFVKRSLAQLDQRLNGRLEFVLPKEDFDEVKDGLLKIYWFEAEQSDTEVLEEIDGNSLVFIKGGGERERFTMIINRNGGTLARHEMSGMCDYFFKSQYLDEKSWLCFTYRKEKTMLKSGMAICIINYNTGALVFDGFIQLGKA